jgi:hypothetical protein
MNDCWTQGDPEDLSQFFHPRMIAITPTERRRLEGGRACVEVWKDFCRSAKIHRWEEKDPSIQVFGDSAVVSYYFDMTFELDGQSITLGGRDLFFFVKEDGRWWAVADQFSPYPA